MSVTLARRGAAWLAVALLISAPPRGAHAQESPPSPAEEAVRATLRDLTAAFNTKDAEALGKLFGEEGLLVDSAGVSTTGREAIVAQYAEAFAEAPDASIEGVLESLQFLTPDVARGEGSFTLDSAPGVLAPATGRFATLVVRQGETWTIAEIRDYPTPPEEVASNEEYLSEFDWMIGDWVDQTENARINSKIRWALNNNYILRDYSIEIPGETSMTGLMILGYDPQAGQVKSWVFDSEGGQGEAYWTRASDNQWVLKARGHLRNGLPTSASQVITLLSNDVVAQSSFDRILGGQVAPDISEVIMVRKPPAPAVTSTAVEVDTPETNPPTDR